MESAKGISDKQVFAFDVHEVKVISHNSAQHSLKSNGILSNGSVEYRSKWFVVIEHYFPSIGIGMEPCETKDHTEHLFLDLAVAFLSFSKGS